MGGWSILFDDGFGCRVRVPEDLQMAQNYGIAIVVQELGL